MAGDLVIMCLESGKQERINIYHFLTALFQCYFSLKTYFPFLTSTSGGTWLFSNKS